MFSIFHLGASIVENVSHGGTLGETMNRDMSMVESMFVRSVGEDSLNQLDSGFINVKMMERIATPEPGE